MVKIYTFFDSVHKSVAHLDLYHSCDRDPGHLSSSSYSSSCQIYLTEVCTQIVISDVIALHLIPSETKIINKSNPDVALSFLGF